MAADWATLKNLPKHAYVLEWDYAGKLAMHRVKVIMKKQSDGYRGFVVALDKTCYRETGWKRTPQGVSIKGEWRRRNELFFTPLEIERAFYRQRTYQLDYAWQDIKRTRLKLEEVIDQFKWLEDMLQRVRGDNGFHDALDRIPKKAPR